MINMSLGGLRDPSNPSRDTYSQLEADAVAYAVSKGVLVVAAVGNADQAPSQPWPYASWPAALPHVLGVSALTAEGSSPSFSNRDPRFNDMAAPGEEILSDLPAAPDERSSRLPGAGVFELRLGRNTATAEGTSFAAPQVAAAAANLFATMPKLTARPGGVRSSSGRAVDAKPDNGCLACALGRDRLTGWGRLDATAALDALAEPFAAADRYEPNDTAGTGAYSLYGAAPRSTPRWTTGTTTSTCTASTSVAGSASTRRWQARPRPTRRWRCGARARRHRSRPRSAGCGARQTGLMGERSRYRAAQRAGTSCSVRLEPTRGRGVPPHDRG